MPNNSPVHIRLDSSESLPCFLGTGVLSLLRSFSFDPNVVVSAQIDLFPALDGRMKPCIKIVFSNPDYTILQYINAVLRPTQIQLHYICQYDFTYDSDTVGDYQEPIRITGSQVVCALENYGVYSYESIRNYMNPLAELLAAFTTVEEHQALLDLLSAHKNEPEIQSLLTKVFPPLQPPSDILEDAKDLQRALAPIQQNQ